MGQKRPSVRLDPKLVERAKALRRGGASIREIARVLECSRSALGEYLAADPEVALAPAAVDSETVELAVKVDAIVDNAASLLNAQLADVARKVKGEPGSPYVGARDIREVRLTVIELRRLVELLHGRPTSRTATVAEDAEPTPDEKAEMERVRALDRQSPS